ncbi:hypothetical protein EJB05_15404, partial [Eragrostis curvula]
MDRNAVEVNAAPSKASLRSLRLHPAATTGRAASAPPSKPSPRPLLTSALAATAGAPPPLPRASRHHALSSPPPSPPPPVRCLRSPVLDVTTPPPCRHHSARPRRHRNPSREQVFIFWRERRLRERGDWLGDFGFVTEESDRCTAAAALLAGEAPPGGVAVTNVVEENSGGMRRRVTALASRRSRHHRLSPTPCSILTARDLQPGALSPDSSVSPSAPAAASAPPSPSVRGGRRTVAAPVAGEGRVLLLRLRFGPARVAEHRSGSGVQCDRFSSQREECYLHAICGRVCVAITKLIKKFKSNAYDMDSSRNCGDDDQEDVAT